VRNAPKVNTLIDVRAIRQAAGGSQEWFAAAINVPVATVRNWEQGRNSPSGAALTLLRMIERDPAATMAILRRLFVIECGTPVRRSMSAFGQ
jgi:DNA-binding transcriptional regulator YiaG